MIFFFFFLSFLSSFYDGILATSTEVICLIVKNEKLNTKSDI